VASSCTDVLKASEKLVTFQTASLPIPEDLSVNNVPVPGQLCVTFTWQLTARSDLILSRLRTSVDQHHGIEAWALNKNEERTPLTVTVRFMDHTAVYTHFSH
jgi:hypothetical protein